MNDGASVMRWDGDAIEPIKDRSDSSNVLLQGAQDRWGLAEDRNGLRSGDGESGWRGSGEYESGPVDTLETSELKWRI